MVKASNLYKDSPPEPDEPMEQSTVKHESTDFAGRPLTPTLPVATAPLSISPIPTCNRYLPWVEAQNIVQKSISHLDKNDQILVNEVIHAHELSFFMTVATPMKSSNLSSPAEFINLAECSVRRMIKFAKTVEMFKLISKDDQIALLKGAVVEVMMLRSAINYDPHTETWSLNTLSCLSNGIATGSDRINAQALKMANPETRKTYSEYSTYIKSLMIVIHGDLVILKLLIVMALFSADRVNVVEKEKIQLVQEKYAIALQNYIRFRFPDEKSLFARAIMKLTEIRDINETHSQMMLKMKLEDIEPLMVEIFDLPT